MLESHRSPSAGPPAQHAEEGSGADLHILAGHEASYWAQPKYQYNV